MLSNNDLTNAIEEAELGIDNEYNEKMKKRDVKRQEILKYKEMRRKEMAEQRLMDLELTRRRLDEIKKVNVNKDWSKMSRQVDQQFKADMKKSKPLSRIDSNVRFNTNCDKRVAKVKREIKSDYNDCSEEDSSGENYYEELIKSKLKRRRFDDRSTDSSKCVIIENLSAQSNEFSISAICQTVGQIDKCCVELVNGKRIGRTYFVHSSDAQDFCHKFNDFQLDGCLIKTFLD